MANKIGAKISASKNPMEEARKALFRPIVVRSNRSTRNEHWLGAYLSTINIEAAKGDIKALREQQWYFETP